MKSEEKRTRLRGLRRSLSNRIRSAPTVLEPHEAYQLWAETYDDRDGNALIFAEESVMRPLLVSSALQGKVVLDAGCGTGRYLEMLQRFEPRMLVGVDFASNMIQQASSKKNLASSVFFQRADLRELPFKTETFDFVLCTLALDHVQELDSAVAELSRVLRQRGTMIISCFHPYGQLLGWKRTFRAESSSGRERWYGVKYYGHLHSSYHRAFELSRLQVIHMHEPVIDESVRHFYERAKRLDLYERFKGFPLLLIFKLRKR